MRTVCKLSFILSVISFDIFQKFKYFFLKLKIPFQSSIPARLVFRLPAILPRILHSPAISGPGGNTTREDAGEVVGPHNTIFGTENIPSQPSLLRFCT